jgi:hypothetical protein
LINENIQYDGCGIHRGLSLTPAPTRADLEEALELVSVGVDVRARSSLFTSYAGVTRVSLELALVEPGLGASGPRVDMFGGIGAGGGEYEEDEHGYAEPTSGLYLDGGLNLGWEWDVGVFSVGLGYGVSVSWEEMLRKSLFMGGEVFIHDPVLLNHRLGLELGVQAGPRVRLGLGYNDMLGYSGLEVRGENDNDQVAALSLDAGVVMRF